MKIILLNAENSLLEGDDVCLPAGCGCLLEPDWFCCGVLNMLALGRVLIYSVPGNVLLIVEGLC